MKLAITEKPSVVLTISKVIGARKRCDRYDEKYAKRNIKDLPIIPKWYKYEVSKSTKKQFNILKKLMNDKEIDIVVNACEAGSEGESIFRLVYNQANCKKKMNAFRMIVKRDDEIANFKKEKYYTNLSMNDFTLSLEQIASMEVA